MPNRLAKETSPYLLQHAENPVDWYPWGDEALQRAQAEDKPILLSIGYSACHWCHVMAHECFENPAIAGLMNENFINIKVDREERPDLDHIYMEAVQAMMNSGGWPLTVFLTPERKPFYGGTYFPPEDRQNLPGFPRILKSVAEAYRNRRESIDQTAFEIEKLLAGLVKNKSVQPLNSEILKNAYVSLEQCFDTQRGGFGGAPKFPYPMTLEFLLRYYLRFKEKRALGMVELALEKMAGGGIYDQLGGGFHRYATDNDWLYPHFEKMLYDNALLSRVYLQVYRVTGSQFPAVIAAETLDYVLREMQDPNGGFYCTQDADSEGQEGKYYLWTLQEFVEELGEEQARKAADYFGVTAEGNFDGRNVLHHTGYTEDPDIKKAKELLLKKRQNRIKPGRDEKILASWNGLMLASLAEAALVLGREDYKAAASANGNFILKSLLSGEKLKHSFKDGRSGTDGFLEDYALVIQGLMALNQATLGAKWLDTALKLTHTLVEQFADRSSGILFDTETGRKDLFVRPKNDFDGALPAGASAATLALLKMASLTENSEFREIAVKNLSQLAKSAEKTPLGYSQWLCDLDFYLSPASEIVLVGGRNDPRTQELLKELGAMWSPNAVLAAFDPEDVDSLKGLPALENRKMVNGQPAVYICRNNTCQAPVTDIKKLKKQLMEE